MKQKHLQNLPHSRALRLAEHITPEKGGATLALSENAATSVTLTALPTGECLLAQTARGDTLAQVLAGCGSFTVGGLRYRVCAGEAIVLPAGVPHAVLAEEELKLLLTVVYPPEANT